MGLLDKIIHGGPETQERKKAEAEARHDALKAEMAGYKKGLIKGAKVKGETRGFAKGSAKGGIGGFVGKMGATMNAFEKGAGPLVGDINFSGIGSGLGGFDAFGMGGGSSPKKRSKPRRRSQPRIVYVERERPHSRRRR